MFCLPCEMSEYNYIKKLDILSYMAYGKVITRE